MLTELGERIDEYSESFNKELENIKKTKIGRASCRERV